MHTANRTVTFDKLGTVDLVVDAVYKGEKGNSVSPISRLLLCENQGGFRIVGNRSKMSYKLCALYSDLSDPNWPDFIEVDTGRFVYYGDNRHPGRELHETAKEGNKLLRFVFDKLHSGHRGEIPPFFIFTKAGEGRDVVFRGLAVPGAPNTSGTEDLIAIWKQSEGSRFQNYRAIFSILDVGVIKRSWITDLHRGEPLTENAPQVWVDWVGHRAHKVLAAERSLEYRKTGEQLPKTQRRRDLVQVIIDYFKEHPRREYAFEECAVEIVKMMDANITKCDLTRPWRDGGRDAVGTYRIGTVGDSISVEFALEAKCKQFKYGSRIEETSRLISRLRYRQFGIFLTTSYVSPQAYEEIKTDGHPVVVLCGEDIGLLLEEKGYKNPDDVQQWLEAHFLIRESTEA